MSGEHNDAFELKATINKLFDDLQRNRLDYKGAVFNADSGFDARAARKMLWNRGVIPNVAENKRNRKTIKRGRKRHFRRDAYKNRLYLLKKGG